MSLAITVNGSRMELAGEVDLQTAPALRAELTDLINAATVGTVLEVSLGEVSFMDSNGLSTLLRAHRLASSREVGLRLVALPGHVERTLSITGLDEVLNVV